MSFGEIDMLPGIRFRSSVTGAATEVEFPTGFFPAVEARVLDELDPFIHRHVAELAAHEADLMIRSLAEAMAGGLLEAHGAVPFAGWLTRIRSGRSLTIPGFPPTAIVPSSVVDTLTCAVLPSRCTRVLPLFISPQGKC